MVETGGLRKFRESLNYTTKSYTKESLYAMAPTAINNGFKYWGIKNKDGKELTKSEKIEYVGNNLLGNDTGYGRHCFGHKDYPTQDYRGRGLIHLTFFTTYRSCSQATGLDIVSNPKLLETDSKSIIESGLWFWESNKIASKADQKNIKLEDAVTNVTRKINTGLKHLAERKTNTKNIYDKYVAKYGSCSGLQEK